MTRHLPILGPIMATLWITGVVCGAMTQYDLSGCHNHEPPAAHRAVHAALNHQVAEFLVEWAPEQRPTAIQAVQYLPPGGTTASEPRWVGTCERGAGFLTIYTLDVGALTETGPVIGPMTISVQTNAEGKVISIE